MQNHAFICEFSFAGSISINLHFRFALITFQILNISKNSHWTLSVIQNHDSEFRILKLSAFACKIMKIVHLFVRLFRLIKLAIHLELAIATLKIGLKYILSHLRGKKFKIAFKIFHDSWSVNEGRLNYGNHLLTEAIRRGGQRTKGSKKGCESPSWEDWEKRVG